MFLDRSMETNVMIYGVSLKPNTISKITVIEITGTVRKTVTIGLKNIENFSLNPAMIPSRNPNTEAMDKPTSSLKIVWKMTDKESALIKILKNADNT
jgi:hypothetical protein